MFNYLFDFLELVWSLITHTLTSITMLFGFVFSFFEHFEWFFSLTPTIVSMSFIIVLSVSLFKLTVGRDNV